MTVETVQGERIKEKIEQTKTTVAESDPWVIRNVAVCNRRSRNGRIYTPAALNDIAQHHQRRPVAIEHEDENGRLVLQRNGQIRNARSDGKRVVAEWHLNSAHTSSAVFLENAKKFPENNCLSIEIDEGQWEGSLGKDGQMEIHHVKEMLDTCVVARGGTTNTIFESLEPKKRRSRKMITEKSVDVDSKVEAKIREADERRKVEDKIDKLTRTLEDTQSLNTKLQEELDKYKLKEERAVKAKAIQEQAKALKAGEISLEYAASLTKLSDPEVEIYLKDRAKLLEAAPSTNSFVETPSVGSTKTQTPHEYSWMKLCG